MDRLGRDMRQCLPMADDLSVDEEENQRIIYL